MLSTLEKKSNKYKTSETSLKQLEAEKKRPKGNWKQRLTERRFSFEGQPLNKQKPKKNKAIKKTLLYVFFLKNIANKEKGKICYSNLKLLKIFLTKYAKIKSRRKTRIKVQEQRKISKSIRRARVEGLLPFTARVIVKRPIKKRKSLSSKGKVYKPLKEA